jgi:hypothetical protein
VLGEQAAVVIGKRSARAPTGSPSQRVQAKRYLSCLFAALLADHYWRFG